MVNIYNIRILKLPKVGEGGGMGGGEERRWGGGLQKHLLRKKKPRQKKGKEFDREKCTLTLIYQYFG